jgi:ABC-type transport system involved in multi-copper enzyme maturation permease subunit
LIIAVILVGLLLILEGVGYRNVSANAGVNTSSIVWLLTFPGAFDGVLEFTYLFLAIIGLIYVATAAGSEWSWGTLKVAVTRGQSRWKYTVSTFASLAIILLIGMLITFAAGLVAVIIGAAIAGLPLGNPFDPAVLARILLELTRCWIALTGLTSLGYAVAMVAKSQMAGIGTVIGFFIVSSIGPALLPDFVGQIFKYMPFSVSGDAIGIQGPPGSGATSAVEPTLALAIIIAWLVGCLLVAAISVERTEITG